jgi:hypothetical protein
MRAEAISKVDARSSEVGRSGDKVAAYGWIQSDKPGRLMMIPKDEICIDAEYQRDAIDNKVLAIAAKWSWVGFGAIVLGHRSGTFWVIDGQHRLLAALRRSDIDALPCIVFETQDVQQEALGFLTLNTGRKPVSIFAKQKAMVVAQDATALFVQQQIDAAGLKLSQHSRGAGTLKCIGVCLRLAALNKQDFQVVLSLAAELCATDAVPVADRLLYGLWYLNANVEGGLSNKRLRERLKDKGARALVESANRAAGFYAKTGSKVFALGMLAEINKGLHKKISLNGGEE